MTFLEQLVAEWYAYRGFFVRTNVKFGKRPAGGYEGEIDVAAFDPKTKRLIHIEASTDANSWTERKERFIKKFSDAKKHYKEIFDFPFDSIENQAIVGFSRKTLNEIDFGNSIKVILVPEFIQEVTQYFNNLNPMKSAVPEGYPLLRAIQFAVAYGKKSGILCYLSKWAMARSLKWRRTFSEGRSTDLPVCQRKEAEDVIRLC